MSNQDDVLIFQLVDLLVNQQFEEALEYLETTGDGVIEFWQESELPYPLLAYAIAAGAPDYVIRELADAFTEGPTIDETVIEVAEQSGRSGLVDYLEELEELHGRSPPPTSPSLSAARLRMHPRNLHDFDDTPTDDEPSDMSFSD